MAKVVVVGGGFAGLATAARLARNRHRVTLLERAGVFGGGLLGVEIGGGLRIPTVSSTFTMPAALRDLFRTTGKPIEDVLQLEPVDPARRYVFTDGARLDLPGGGRAATMRAFDEAFGAGAGAEWESLLVRGREMWEVLRREVVEQPLDGRRDLVRALASRPGLAILTPWRSLSAFAESTLSDPHARQLLATYAQALGAAPRHAPAALAVLAYLENAFGVWRIAAGPVRLVSALAERAQLRGAELRTSAEVTAIAVAGGRVTSVRLLDGEQLPADVVVVAIDVRAASRLVVGARPWHVDRGGRAGTAQLTVVLGAAEPGADEPEAGPDREHGPAETIYLGNLGEPRPPRPAAALSTPGPITAAPIAVSRHEVGDTPLWSVQTQVPVHGSTGPDWRAPGAAEAYARMLLDVLAARGLDMRTAPVRAIQTPADLEDLTGAPGGAVLGPPPRGFAAAFGRAANRTRIGGLYAAGATAHPGPQLPFVALSAGIVSDLIGTAPRPGGGLPTWQGTAGQ